MDSLSILLFSCHFIKHICDFFGWCFCSQTEDNNHRKADSKTYSQRIKSCIRTKSLSCRKRYIVPDDNCQTTGNNTCNCTCKVCSSPEQLHYHSLTKCCTKTGPCIGYQSHDTAVRIPRDHKCQNRHHDNRKSCNCKDFL